jgi:hypothetical protein
VNHAKNVVKTSAKLIYMHPKSHMRLVLESGPTLMTSVTFGLPNLGAGAEVGFNFASARLTTYNAAIWCFYRDCEVVLRHISEDKHSFSPGAISLSYFRRLNDQAKVGGEFMTNVIERKAQIQFGGKYKPIPSTTLAGKVDFNGQLGLSYRYRANPYFKLTTSSSVDLRKLTAFSIADYRMGFHLKFANSSN